MFLYTNMTRDKQTCTQRCVNGNRIAICEQELNLHGDILDLFLWQLENTN